MAIRQIWNDESMDAVLKELDYTIARLHADARTKALAPRFEALVARADQVMLGQRAAWRAETRAAAAVDAADDGLDDVVREVARDLLHALGDDRRHPRFVRYFQESPSALIGRALDAEIEVVREWPASLAGEPEPAVSAHAAPLAAAIAEGSAAIVGRDAAAGRRADHRAREIANLVDSVNEARRSSFGELVTLAATQHLPNAWPDRFFLHERTMRAKPAARPPGSPAPA